MRGSSTAGTAGSRSCRYCRKSRCEIPAWPANGGCALTASVRIFPQSSGVRSAAAAVTMSVCKPDVAVKSLDAKTLLARGDDFNIKGELDRAIADYDAALKVEPALAEALNSRGMAARQGRSPPCAVGFRCRAETEAGL